MAIRNRAQLRRLDVVRRQAARVPDVVRDKRDAERAMAAFDRLGARARQVISQSRFDADAERVVRQYDPRFADDTAVAKRLLAEDDKYSGYFGPRTPCGI